MKDRQVFKRQCIELRSEGLSLGEIVKTLGRPKTSVYFHIRNVQLAREKLDKIRNRGLLALHKASRAKKGKSTRNFKHFDKWNERNVTLIAHLLFDGELKYSACVYSNRNRVLINEVKDYMKSIYKYKPHELVQNEVIRISYFNVALTNYLRNKALTLLQEIHHSPINLKISMEFISKQNICILFSGQLLRPFQYSL